MVRNPSALFFSFFFLGLARDFSPEQAGAAPPPIPAFAEPPAREKPENAFTAPRASHQTQEHVKCSPRTPASISAGEATVSAQRAVDQHRRAPSLSLLSRRIRIQRFGSVRAQVNRPG